MEKKRLKIGILFNFSPQWMGGVIYIINIIHTLDFLEDADKPQILLFYRSDLSKFIPEIKYPYLEAHEWKFPSLFKGYCKSLLTRRNVFIQDIIKKYPLDVLFPMHDFPVKSGKNVKLVSWWADLQHKHYPGFFSHSQVLARDIRTKLILRNCDHLVLSSNDVRNDFLKFYAVPKELNIHIFHFVSVIESFNMPETDIKKRYHLPEEYFLVSNQFHKHKNHRIVLLALARLKESGTKIHVAFTGKLPGQVNSAYLTEIHNIIESNKLHDQVTFLGVINRSDQLQLMKLSQAIIQPSLFEGWSTVNEDAKSLQVPVIASDLAVNIEQMEQQATYFDPHDEHGLAQILSTFPKRDVHQVLYEPYETRLKRAARELLEIFQS
jgi:glycosyltransferase involved in cell wall biosynthesis